MAVASLVSFNAILLNYTFNTHEFFERNNYLPALFYFLIIGFFPASIHLNGELIAHTFIILAINQLFNIRQNEPAKSIVFNTAFFIGLASLFNPIYIYFIFVVFGSLISIRPFKLREYLLPFIALIIPYFWVYLYEPKFYESFIKFDAYLDFERLATSVIILPNLFIVLLLIISGIKINKRLNSSSIRFRRLSRIILINVLFSVVVSSIMFLQFKSYYYFSIGAISLPFILSYSILEDKKRFNLSKVIIYILFAFQLIKFV